MSFSIPITQNNISNTQNNSQWQYNFLNGAFRMQNMEMCISTVSIPYSWYNVTSLNGNNSFNYTWWNGTVYNIVLPDGFYAVPDIQNYIEQTMISNSQYLIDGNGNYIFYLSMYYNVTYYAVQLIALTVPTSAQAVALGLTAPSGWGGYPTVATTCQLVVLNNNFINLIGFTPGSYPVTNQTSNYNIDSSFTPQGSIVNSLLLNCNLVNNPVNANSVILDGWPINAVFGSSITYQPNYEKWITLNNGTYSNFNLSMVDQNGNTVYARDGSGTITLLIRKKLSSNSV